MTPRLLTAAAFIALAIATSGCAGLILRPMDSAPAKTAKVATRVLVFPLTVGMSELKIHRIKQWERAYQIEAAAFEACRDAVGEENRRRACMEYDHIKGKISAAQAAENAAASRRTTCQSHKVGYSVVTNCY